MKYLFSTTTSIKERTYIVVTAEATVVDIEAEEQSFNTDSMATQIERRIENPFRIEKKEEVKEEAVADSENKDNQK